MTELHATMRSSPRISGSMRQSVSLSGHFGAVFGGGGIASPEIKIIRVLDRAEYDAITAKDTHTLYFIRG